MSDSESTPIESVLDVDKSHEADANAALAELSGGTPVAPSPSPKHPPYDDSFAEPDVSSSASEMDLWISMMATVATVCVAVFVLFMPSVRVLLGPLIGTGYVALGIRAAVIGCLSIVPHLVLM